MRRDYYQGNGECDQEPVERGVKAWFKRLVVRELENADMFDVMMFTLMLLIVLVVAVFVVWGIIALVIEILTSFGGIIAVAMLGYGVYKLYPVFKKGVL